MPRPRVSKKDRFEDVPEEFKTELYSLSDEEVKKKIAVVAMNQTELMIAKKNDQAYEQAKDVFSAAGAVYRDGTKMNRLKIELMYDILESRGKA